jgi:hypothetical protein
VDRITAAEGDPLAWDPTGPIEDAAHCDALQPHQNPSARINHRNRDLVGPGGYAKTSQQIALYDIIALGAFLRNHFRKAN